MAIKKHDLDNWTPVDSSNPLKSLAHEINENLDAIISSGTAPLTTVQNTITLGAVTTAPTTGTRTVQRIESQTVGDKIRLTYKLGYAAGTNAGSGHYLLSLPTGVTFNTTYNPTYNGANEWTGDVQGQAPNLIVAAGGIIIPGGWSNQIMVVPYDSTRFRLLLTFNGNQGQYGYWSNAFYAVSSNTSLNLQFEIWK